jgi:hypothetical protein
VLTELDIIKSDTDKKNYEHDLTLVFWFAVHLEDFNMVTALVNREFLLKQLVTCALLNKKGEMGDSDEDSDIGEEWNVNDNASESFKSEELSEEEKEDGGPGDNGNDQ